MKIVLPSDPEFHATGSPFGKSQRPPNKRAESTPEIEIALNHLLKALAASLPEIIPHLASGGTILIGTNSKAVMELHFAGLAGVRQ